MAMSNTTTSGRSFGAASSSARPSVTAPTTSQSGSSSLTNASRSSRWSSASRTRGRFTRGSYRWCLRSFSQRDTDVELGAARRLRVDRDLASERTHPLTHADEPEPTLALDLPGFEPTPMIDDPQVDRVRSAAQRDLGLLGAAVLDGISQSLLGDAIEAHGRIRRDRWRDLIVSELDLEAVVMSQLPAEVADRRHESELLQLRRMELVRQVVHGRRQVFDLGQQLVHPCAELARCLRRLLAEEIHPDRQERQALAQIVVQLTRDPPSFVLLGLEQSAGEDPQLHLAPPQPFFGLLAQADIRDRGQDERPRAGLRRAQRDLHRELASVFAPPEELPPCPHETDLGRGGKSLPMISVLRPKAFRHQHLHGLTDQLFPGVAKELLRLRVGHGDEAVGSNHEHPVGSRLDHLPVLLVRPSAARPLSEQRNAPPRLRADDPHGPDDPRAAQLPADRLPEAAVTRLRQARPPEAPTPP